MKKLLLVFILTLLCSSVFAQAEVTILDADGQVAFTFLRNTPDPAIRQLPRTIADLRQRDTEEFVRQLVNYINESSSCDFERVKKAHDWVALNIRYDTQSYFSGRYASQTSLDVIRRGNGVCAGYADAFKYILDTLQIENRKVSGYARGVGSSIFIYTNVTNSNHEWNIVTIRRKTISYRLNLEFRFFKWENLSSQL